MERILIAHHGAHLYIEIRIMLGQRPDRKDQVMRVDPGDTACAFPSAQKLRLFIDKTAQITAQMRGDMRGTLQDFIGEKTAFARVIAAHVELALAPCQRFTE